MSRRNNSAGLVPLGDYQSAVPSMRGGHGIVARNSSSRHVDWFRIVDKKDNSPAEVYIYDEIGFWGTTAQRFVDQVKAIKASQIDLHLNSPGGEVFDGVAIYNALKSHSASVNVFVDGLAASAASFIAQAGDTVTMRLGSMMMIHDGLGIVLGNQQDMLAMAELLGKVSDNIAQIYADRTGQTAAYWRAFMQAETWYSAQEAVDAGLADKVSSDAAEQNPTNQWDFSVFNYNGRDNAPSPEETLQQILNKATKEAPVSGKPGVKNTEPGTGTPPADPPQADPPTETPPADPPTATPPAPPAQPEAKVVLNAAGVPTFMVNGAQTVDFQAVQQHITVLETFASETREANRKAFVSSLAEPKKRITAAQIPATEEFALSLTDEQYAKWVASWEAAPVLSLFGQHADSGGQPGNGQPDPKQEKIDTALAIVAQHQKGGMPQAAVEKTPSWKFLADNNALPTT